MQDGNQVNRITVWFLFDPSDTLILKSEEPTKWNIYKTEKPKDYGHLFRDTLFEKINIIVKGTEWGIAFRQTDELTPCFDVKIYLDNADYLTQVVDTIQNNNKDIVFNCLPDGDFSDFIDGKFQKDPPIGGVML